MRWPQAGHNDVKMLYGTQWREEVSALLELAAAYENPFPVGCLVEAHSLSAAGFNGLQGRVRGPAGDRIRVDFPDKGEKALKPANLKVVGPPVKSYDKEAAKNFL